MITARNLTKNFDGFMALDGVSFGFEDGEIFVRLRAVIIRVAFLIRCGWNQ